MLTKINPVYESVELKPWTGIQKMIAERSILWQNMFRKKTI